MKNTIRCCIACILPCGALDVIRIVHSNGHVQEISGSILAADIMRAHPKHVLKKPTSHAAPNIVVLPPDAQLQRGKIYFLMPAPPDTSSKKTRHKKKTAAPRPPSAPPRHGGADMNTTNNNSLAVANMNLLLSDQYLTEILSEKLSSHRDRRRGRAAVWRPHLESISELPNDT